MLLLLLGYKVRNLSKFTCFGPNLWSFLVHFSPFFCARHPTQLRKAHRRELATWCTTYCCKVWSLSNQTISTVDHGICLFSGGNFQHWSSPFCLPNFPELSRSSKPHFGSQSPGGKFHVEPVKVFAAILMREWIKHFSTIWSERLKRVWEQLPGNSFQRTDIYRDHIWPTVATTCHDVLMFTVY